MSRLGVWICLVIASLGYHYSTPLLLGRPPLLDWLDGSFFGGAALAAHWWINRNNATTHEESTCK